MHFYAPWWLLSRHTVMCCVVQETRGVRQTIVYFKRGMKMSLVARHSLQTNFLSKFHRGGAPSILNWSWIRQTVPKKCTFKFVCVFIFIVVLLFAALFEIAITCVCFNEMPWNLDHIETYLRFTFCRKRIKKAELLSMLKFPDVIFIYSCLQVKPPG